jgi:hypothetical protein
VWGSGTFNIEDGAELKVPGTGNNLRHVYLIRALQGSGSGPVTINVNGGTLEALMPNATAIDDDNFDLSPVININGGTINVPHGNAAVGNVTVNNAASVTGTVIDKNNTWSDWSIALYGNCSVQTIFEDDENNEKTIENISWQIMSGAIAKVEAGTTWSIRDSWTLQNDGTLNIYGTVINFDKLINEGTIDNYSGNTLDNRGTLTNNSTIKNGSTGKITNTGSIVNTDGEIDNTAGGTFESVQTASEMGGNIKGPVELIDNDNPSSGGCSTGSGLYGLLSLAVFAIYKKRLAA